MLSGLLMELDDHNCWTIAEAVGHCGPHRLQHLLSRAVWDDQQVLDIASAWAVSHLEDGDAVLIVDETADEKSSADAAGAARQYSGTIGGIALCQVAVTVTYATSRGHALIGRALYLPEGCAADKEHRELAGVPEEVLFATKPQLAGALLDRAQSLGIRAAFLAGDEVYGGRELRRGIRQREMGYVLAVRANHVVTTGSGRTVTAAGAARMIPGHAWHRMRTGSGTKGTRHYDWAMLQVTSDDTPRGHDDGHSVLLARRHRYTGTLSFYRCWTPGPAPLARLIAIAVIRWRIEMVFTQLAIRAVRPVGGGWQDVADLDVAVGDHDAVDEQFSQQPALLEGGGGQSGADGLAECLDTVGDGLQFQPLSGGGVQLALLGRQGGAAAVQLVPLALEFGQGDDLGQVGVEQLLLLAVQLAQGLADGRLPGVEFLGSQAPPCARSSARATWAGSVTRAHRSAQTSSSSCPAGM
jgi:SRSO17 transposase